MQMSLEHVKGLNWHRYAQEMSTVLRQCTCMPPPPPPSHFSFHELYLLKGWRTNWFFFREHYLQYSTKKKKNISQRRGELVPGKLRKQMQTLNKDRFLNSPYIHTYIYITLHIGKLPCQTDQTQTVNCVCWYSYFFSWHLLIPPWQQMRERRPL